MPQVFPQNHDPDGESSVTGLVHSVESCGTVDGPGIRFVLFLSGCSLRCRYCHNPDTSYVRRGRLRSADDVLKEIARYRDFLQAAGGGVTLSGGAVKRLLEKGDGDAALLYPALRSSRSATSARW